MGIDVCLFGLGFKAEEDTGRYVLRTCFQLDPTTFYHLPIIPSYYGFIKALANP